VRTLAYIGWKVIPRIKIGPLSVSPHGLGIAAGYASGGTLLARRAERLYGVKREHIWNMLMYAVVGVVVGARLFYVVGHAGDYITHPLEIFKVWKGGIVLYGGIFGGIAAAYPYARKHRLNYVQILDAAAPCFPLGLIFGRIGDLVIGDHLGGPTNFFLGWQYKGGQLPDRVLVPGVNCGNPCVVHQTALYDLIVVLILFPLVLWLGRKRHRDGWLITVTAMLYAVGRFTTDFARTQDANGRPPPGFLGLHGTQWVSLALLLFGVFYLVRISRRPPSAAEPDAEDDEHAADMVSEGGPVSEPAPGEMPAD
jgi:phosphatidylglycerol:prolipoprotein diacylglycerol transferase